MARRCSRPWKPSPGLEWQPPKSRLWSDGPSHRGARTKSDFCLNKNGRLVSKKQSAHGKRAFKNIRGWTQAVSKARKALGITGFCAVKKGTPLYKKAREFYCAATVRPRSTTKRVPALAYGRSKHRPQPSVSKH